MTFGRSNIALGLTLGLVSLALSPGAAQAQVKVGVGAPMTGGSAAFGAQFKQGVEQAVEDINAAGGISARRSCSTSVTTGPTPRRACRSPTSSPPTA